MVNFVPSFIKVIILVFQLNSNRCDYHLRQLGFYKRHANWFWLTQKIFIHNYNKLGR